MTNYSSSFLLQKNSFLIWMWSIWNITWNYYNFNRSETPEIADKKALENDFWMVGKDITSATNTFKDNLRSDGK